MMEQNGKGRHDAALKNMEYLFTRGPVTFVRWLNKRNWPVEYISSNISQLGYRQEDFDSGRLKFADIIFSEDRAAFSAGLIKLHPGHNNGDSFKGEVRLVTAYGSVKTLYHFTLAGTDSPVPGKNKNTYFYAYLMDPGGGPREENNTEIEYRAYHDPLTGLPNRSLFMDRLNMEINRAQRTGQRFGLMFLDLDNFKDINDSLGHIMGDYLLQDAGKRLLEYIRDVDTVARIGGDEFTLLLPGLSKPEEIVNIAQRILDAFKEPFNVKNYELFSTASIGICFYPADGKDSVELLKNADLAMYHAKDQGKNNYEFFSREMNIRVRRRLAMENQLQRALIENQMALHYQPLVELETGTIVGTEALIRWNHPEQGIIKPDDFIPLAEDTGLILQLGQWVLETACNQNQAWRQQGLDPKYVSINVSSRQFFRKDFLESIKRVFLSTGLDTGSLALQVTENGIRGNRRKIVTIMSALKKIGVKLSIDDFGKGFSSLDHLKCFPVDTFKIDRSFIGKIPHDPDCVAVTRSIISLAHNLKKTVLAEGVETEAQLEFLLRHGCDQMQGYYFSRPVSPAEISRMLEEGKSLYK